MSNIKNAWRVLVSEVERLAYHEPKSNTQAVLALLVLPAAYSQLRRDILGDPISETEVEYMRVQLRDLTLRRRPSKKGVFWCHNRSSWRKPSGCDHCRIAQNDGCSGHTAHMAAGSATSRPQTWYLVMEFLDLVGIRILEALEWWVRYWPITIALPLVRIGYAVLFHSANPWLLLAPFLFAVGYLVVAVIVAIGLAVDLARQH